MPTPIPDSNILAIQLQNAAGSARNAPAKSKLPFKF